MINWGIPKDATLIELAEKESSCSRVVKNVIRSIYWNIFSFTILSRVKFFSLRESIRML